MRISGAFILIAILALLITPAAAYTLEHENDIYGTTSGAGMSVLSSFTIINGTLFDERGITRITFHSDAARYPQPVQASGSLPVRIITSACAWPDSGNGTYSWDYGWSDAATYVNSIDITLDFPDTVSNCAFSEGSAGIQVKTLADAWIVYGDVGHSSNSVYHYKNASHPSGDLDTYTNTYYLRGTYSLYSGVEEVPTVDYSGDPLDGYSPLSVLFTIQNFTEVNITGSSWTFGDGQVANVTASTINHTYQNPGIYTVSLHYFNTTGYEDTITKNDYVLASIPSGMIVNLDVKDAISGALIQDCTVGIQNTTTGVWRNGTAPTGLVYFSTTDPGYLYPLSQNQSIMLAANKTGYAPGSLTFNIPYDNYRARLFLMPLNIINATGTGNVVANVIRNKDGLTVSGMSVVLDTGQMGITNSAGATTLRNVTAGTRYATVTDPDGAYQSTKYAFELAEGETKLIVIQVLLNGETPVPTFVSPTPTGTYDPSDPSSPGYGNYTASQVNQAGGEGIMQMLGQLISLWPLVVIGVFMKFMKSAFS